MLDLPCTLQRHGFYYGWVVLAAGTIGIIASVPGQTMGVSVFSESFMAGLHLDRVRLSGAFMVGTLASSFLLPLVGRLLDRLGARIMSVVAATGLALSLGLLAVSPHLAAALTTVTHCRPTSAGLAVLFLCFVGTRHFGQGQLTMISRTMIGRWFDRHRGRVMGVSGLFTAFGFGVAPLVLTRLINRFGWQGALWVLAACLLGMALFAWAFYRPAPERCGLQVDGGGLRPATAAPPGDLEERTFTVAQAKRTAAFWIFNLGFATHAMLGTAMTFHMARIGLTHGLTEPAVFRIFLPIGIIATACDLAAGVVSDRVPMRYLLAVMMSGLCLWLLTIDHIGTPWGFWLTAAGHGLASGLFSLLTGAAWPKLFGRTHLGAIAGANMAWIVAGSAVGPFLFSQAQSWTGHFTVAFHWGLLAPAAVLVASFWAIPPQKSGAGGTASPARPAVGPDAAGVR
jgi:OFA family oxalate/formate antiporter-like MFS transporter